MFNDKNGPIEHFSWGKYIINNTEHSKLTTKKGAGKDIRIVNNEVTKWKERKGHLLSKKMITGVFDNDLDTLIIGIGVNGALKCPDEVIKYIHKNGIKHVKVLRTPEACKFYNKLYNKGIKTGLLAHGTC